MAMTLKQLEEQLNMSTYTPKTDEQLQAEAENRYKSQYAQNRTSAQQAYDTSALALDQQRAGLETSYAKQAEQAAQATRQNYAAADRQSLTRGMQRSSYNNATLANINNAGAKTQNEIQQALTTAQGNVDQQKTLLTQQLAQTLAGYETGYANDVAAYLDTLKQQEYERKLASDQYRNELLMALYEYGQQAARGGGGGGSRSSGGGSSAASAGTAGGSYNSLYAALNAGSGSIAGLTTGAAAAKGASSLLNAAKQTKKPKVTIDPKVNKSTRATK